MRLQHIINIPIYKHVDTTVDVCMHACMHTYADQCAVKKENTGRNAKSPMLNIFRA